MVTPRGFLSSEIFRRSRTRTDLNTGVTSIASIARVVAVDHNRSIIVIIIIIVNDNGLADDLFETLVVAIGLSTPLKDLFESERLYLLTAGLPVCQFGGKECIVISIRVSNPCNDSILHALRERKALSTANTHGFLVPGMSNNFIEVVLRNFGKQLLDRGTNLLRGFLVALRLITVIGDTLLCKS